MIIIIITENDELEPGMIIEKQVKGKRFIMDMPMLP